ncbi:unnamed protein product [Amoebophrya sp. A120]|nr:unnamed protein product [Amoebophrya sp. A120]|eukprot:GSA120T00012341001.1
MDTSAQRPVSQKSSKNPDEFVVVPVLAESYRLVQDFPLRNGDSSASSAKGTTKPEVLLNDRKGGNEPDQKMLSACENDGRTSKEVAARTTSTKHSTTSRSAADEATTLLDGRDKDIENHLVHDPTTRQATRTATISWWTRNKASKGAFLLAAVLVIVFLIAAYVAIAYFSELKNQPKKILHTHQEILETTRRPGTEQTAEAVFNVEGAVRFEQDHSSSSPEERTATSVGSRTDREASGSTIEQEKPKREELLKVLRLNADGSATSTAVSEATTQHLPSDTYHPFLDADGDEEVVTEDDSASAAADEKDDLASRQEGPHEAVAYPDEITQFPSLEATSSSPQSPAPLEAPDEGVKRKITGLSNLATSSSLHQPVPELLDRTWSLLPARIQSENAGALATGDEDRPRARHENSASLSTNTDKSKLLDTHDVKITQHEAGLSQIPGAGDFNDFFWKTEWPATLGDKEVDVGGSESSAQAGTDEVDMTLPKDAHSSAYFSVKPARELRCLCPNWNTLAEQTRKREVPRSNVFVISPQVPAVISKEDAQAMFPGLLSDAGNSREAAGGDESGSTNSDCGLSPGIQHFSHEAAWRAVELVSSFLESEKLLQDKSITLLDAFEDLNSWSSRADLFRTAVVYLCGGVYIDGKTAAARNGQADAIAAGHKLEQLAVLDTLFSNDTMAQDPADVSRTHSAIVLATGDLGICLDPGWNMGSTKGKLQNAFFAAPPQASALLYILQQQIRNVQSHSRGHAEDRGKRDIDAVGPGAFVDALLQHECFRRTFLPRCVADGTGHFPDTATSELRDINAEWAFVKLDQDWLRGKMIPFAVERRDDAETSGKSGSSRGKTADAACQSDQQLAEDLMSIDFDDFSQEAYDKKYRESLLGEFFDRAWHTKANPYSDNRLDLERGTLITWDGEEHAQTHQHSANRKSSWDTESCGDGGYQELFQKKNFYCSNLADPVCSLACSDKHEYLETSGTTGSDGAHKAEAVPAQMAFSGGLSTYAGQLHQAEKRKAGDRRTRTESSGTTYMFHHCPSILDPRNGWGIVRTVKRCLEALLDAVDKNRISKPKTIFIFEDDAVWLPNYRADGSYFRGQERPTSASVETKMLDTTSLKEAARAISDAWPKDTALVLLAAQQHARAPPVPSVLALDSPRGLTGYKLAQIDLADGAYAWAIRFDDISSFVEEDLGAELEHVGESLAMDHGWFSWAKKSGRVVRVTCPLLAGHREAFSLTHNNTQGALLSRDCPQELLMQPRRASFLESADDLDLSLHSEVVSGSDEDQQEHDAEQVLLDDVDEDKSKTSLAEPGRDEKMKVKNLHKNRGGRASSTETLRERTSSASSPRRIKSENLLVPFDKWASTSSSSAEPPHGNDPSGANPTDRGDDVLFMVVGFAESDANAPEDSKHKLETFLMSNDFANGSAEKEQPGTTAGTRDDAASGAGDDRTARRHVDVGVNESFATQSGTDEVDMTEPEQKHSSALFSVKPAYLETSGTTGMVQEEKQPTSFTTVLTTEDKRDGMQMHVLILSARENFAKRQVIRETWLKANWTRSEANNTSRSRRPWAHFIVGAQGCEIPLAERIAGDLAVGGYCTLREDHDSNLENGVSTAEQEAWLLQREKEQHLTAALQQEESKYRDMVLLPMVDVYHNITMKMKLAFQWVTSQDFSDKLEWIIKVDDDAYMRRFSLLRFLFPHKDDQVPTKGLDPKSEKILLGLVHRRGAVQHDPTTSKNVEKDYPHNHYPPFVSGAAGEVFSRTLVDYVVHHEAELFNYAGEDYAFGIWAEEQMIPGVRVVPTVQKFSNGTERQRWFKYGNNCCEDPEVVIGGDLTAEQIRACAENDARRPSLLIDSGSNQCCH